MSVQTTLVSPSSNQTHVRFALNPEPNHSYGTPYIRSEGFAFELRVGDRNREHIDMSCCLNSLKGVIGHYIREYCRGYSGDTRSLDYSS